MSDITNENAPVEEQPRDAEVAGAADVPVPAVVAQEAKVVGDDEQPEPRDVQVDVNQEQVAAQVAQPREGDTDKVNVHEVSVTVDEPVLDPASPLAVQVPDAGRSPLLTQGLPIAGLDAERAEDVFAREARKSDDE